jgi:replicative DNA helicase
MLQDSAERIALAIEANLSPEHFHLPAHTTLFGFLLELYNAGIPIELVSLVQKLLDRGILDHVGGPSSVTDLYTYAPTHGHFQIHLQQVKDKHALRKMLEVSNATIARVYEEPEDVDAILDASEADILSIRNLRENLQVRTIVNSLEWAINDFEQRVSGESPLQGTATGYERLDHMTGGLKPGEMFVVAARPSMGKTSFMMNLIEHICIDQGKPSMVFSCEMSQDQLVQRLLYGRARFDAGQLNRGYHPNKGELGKFQTAALQIKHAPLHIDDTPGITISHLRAKARRAKRQHKIELIAIDYLQLMKSTSKQAKDSREREIAEISAGIKGLAKELELPIIILAQLNRGPETRAGKNTGVPRMSDLRESGAIEQDADLVGLLYRKDYYAATAEEKEECAGRAELILAKNRNGQTGHVPLTFIAPLMRFESGQPAEEPSTPQPTVRRRKDLQ